MNDEAFQEGERTVRLLGNLACQRFKQQHLAMHQYNTVMMLWLDLAASDHIAIWADAAQAHNQ